MKHNKLNLLLLTALLSPAALPAASQQDSLRHVVLQEVTLTENRNLSALSGSLASGIRIDSKVMKTYPRLFGYTDPMRYLQSMPGVSTNGDQSGGLHVQGGESSHNLITVSDAPVYGTLNFTGMFSLFNQDHLSTVQFSTTTPQPFLGAGLALDHADTIPNKISGIATLGLISAQGTVSAPISDRTAITLSLRRSFINTVYGSLMTFDDNPLEYGFTDANLTLLTRLDQRNTIDLNMLINRDHGSTIFGRSKIMMDCRWGNTLASLRWRHRDSRITSSTSLFVTRYALMGKMDNGQNKGYMPANITHSGIKTAVTLPYTINIEADANLYHILPQDPHVETNQAGTASQPAQQVLLGNISLSRPFKPGQRLTITPNLLLSAYTEKGQYDCVNPDPALTLEYNLFRKGTITLQSGIKHQYLAQTGMSNVGLPIEFWVAAGRYFKPQKATYGTLSYDLSFIQSRYNLSLQAFYRRLSNQLEYTGFLYDLLSRPYHLEDNLLICSGYNYGLNVMLSKQAGQLTGWLSYSYGQSLREGDGDLYPRLFHSSHERRHEFNAVMNYTIGRFELGANFILASGCPYTPARNLYLVANTLFIYYDEYNSAQLPPYLRLDLSATYNLLLRGRLNHSFNFSLFNATAHKNYTWGYINADEDKLTIRYRLSQMMIPVIPSISYTCRF